MRQSEVVDLPSSFCHTIAVPGQCAFADASLLLAGIATEQGSDLPADFSDSSNLRTSSSNNPGFPSACSFVGGSIGDAKASLLGFPGGSQHRIFILLPQPDPQSNNQHWNEPGWRFYHATALASGVPSADMCFVAASTAKSAKRGHKVS